MKKPVPLADQPRPSSSVEQIVEDMTGKTDIKAGEKAKAALRKIQAQETKDLNDQQKARLKELQDLQQKSKDTGNALIKDYDGQYQTKMGELQGKIDAEIQAAVVKMASVRKEGVSELWHARPRACALAVDMYWVADPPREANVALSGQQGAYRPKPPRAPTGAFSRVAAQYNGGR